MSNLTENSSLLTVDLYVDLNEADLVRLNYRCMTDEYKTMIKLAANCALDVPFDLDIQESLLEIHKKIEDKITRDRMKEINYFILKMIENELKQKDDPLYQPQRAANGNALPLFDIREYRHFDKLLILGKMVALMEEADYMKFRKAIADDKLSYSPVQLDYIPSRYFLIKCLLEDEKIDEKLHLMYKWLDKTGCSRYRIYLEEYSKRHDFSIPKQDMITRIAIYISNLKYPKTFCSLLIILIVIIVALVVVPITYGQSYDTMKSFSSMIGANTTVLLQQECKSANELKDLESVTVSTESTSDYDVIIFLTNYTVSKVPVQLPQRSLPYPLKGRHNFGINYYRNDPIYTTGRSILSYTVSVTADDDNSTECPVEFYLFDNNNTYREFIRYIDKRVPNYINCSSLCNEENRIVEPVQEFNFSVTTPGFYFVGGSLQDEVSVNVTISAELQAYKYSSHLQPQ
ncbi:PREDICTED: uncharacterized protein LOC109592226, partial [Amphimedon queenslandica]|uniref:Uncharacterized protein n=2 Tax=Amphimedon queenslandica TaxID=400682 RepID=A0AAN0K1S0_AMPQE